MPDRIGPTSIATLQAGLMLTIWHHLIIILLGTEMENANLLANRIEKPLGAASGYDPNS